jgi:hypothetical protein
MHSTAINKGLEKKVIIVRDVKPGKDNQDINVL